MRTNDFSFSCLVGPLSPDFYWQDHQIVHPLAPPGCLGAYRQHPQVHCFEMQPEMLFENDAAWAVLPQVLQQSRQKQVPMQFGAATDYQLKPLLAQRECEVLIWWGLHHPLPLDLAELSLFKVLIVSDWHFYAQSLPAALQAFDLILCDRLLLGKLQAQGLENVMYWPAFSFDPSLIPQAAQRAHPQRDLELVFLGKQHPAYYQKRNHLLWRWAASDLPMYLDQMPFEAYLDTLARSQMVLNHALRREMNLRSSEVAACGALLFCEAENLELFDILPAGEACVAYTPETLIDKMRYYRRHPAERQALARKGQELIQAYSYEANFARLLAQLPDWRRRFETKAQGRAQRPGPPPEHEGFKGAEGKPDLSFLPSLRPWRLQLGQAEMHMASAKPVGRLRALVMLEQVYERVNALIDPDPQALLWLEYAFYAQTLACYDLETYLINDCLNSEKNMNGSSEPRWPADLRLNTPLPQRRQSLELALKQFMAQQAEQTDIRVDLILHNLAWGAQLTQNPAALAEHLAQIQARQQFWNQTGHRNGKSQALLELPKVQNYLAYLLPVRSGPQYLLRQNLALQARDTHWAQGHHNLLEASELYLLAHQALFLGQTEAALAALQGVRQRVPSWAEVYFACAKLLLQNQQLEAACTWLETGLQQGVFYPEIWVLWIELLRQLGREKELKQRRYEAARLFQGAQYADWHTYFANPAGEC